MGLQHRLTDWLHRECRRGQAYADILLQVGGRLGDCAAAVNALAVEVRKPAPAFVTVLVIGTDAPGREEAADAFTCPIIFATSAKVRGRGSEPIAVDIHRPMKNCQIVVLADLERVDVRGIFCGSDVLTMTGPLAYCESIQPGVLVRVVCELRE